MRQRAHAILLSAEGLAISELMVIFDKSRPTIASWLSRWESKRFSGLADAMRCGAPTKLTEAEQIEAVQWIREHPRDLRAVRQLVQERRGKTVGRGLLCRPARRAGLCFKRVRKSLKNRRNEQEFREGQELLNEILTDAERGEIDVYFVDESGFSLTPSVPYAWQPVGERLEVPSQRSQQLNVLGFPRHDGEKFCPYTCEHTLDGETVANLTRDFVMNELTRDTILAYDNASIHKCPAMRQLIEECESRNILFWFLPAYCPELNRIEILWKMIKHRWLSFEAYKDLDSLRKHLQSLLSKIGDAYRVHFARVTGGG